MAAYSGKEGLVIADASQSLEELREWKLDYQMDAHSYASRNGGGAMQTVAGVEHGSGSVTVNFDATNPIAGVLPVGRLVAFQLQCTNTGEKCSGSGRITQHSYNPKLSGEEQTVTVSFVTHGAWTLPTA